MKLEFQFPILRDESCVHSSCESRSKLSVHKARMRIMLLNLRICSLICLAAFLGGAVMEMVAHAQTAAQTRAAQATIEQFEIQEIRVELRTEVERLRNMIALQGVAVTEQGKDISKLFGIGIGLGSILLVLQVAQIITGKGAK